MIALPQGPDFRLQGRRALVTGGSGGIGVAAAAALGRAGAHVTVAARREPELAQVCEALRAAGIGCASRVLDVTDSAAVDRLVLDDEPFDVLVNNAGMNRPKPLVEQSDDDIDAVLDLNVKAAFYTSRAVARRLLKAGRPGSIINVSSQMGHVGSPRRTLYCASKHALEGMTRALAWELGAAGIRVNTVCPTFIETPMTAGMLEEPGFREWICARNALGRVGRLDEVMGAIVFLASDASSLMTGSALMLDAGWTAA
ncbi:SDR family NAD(P)-dependent oxidoreductase [Bordetella hinzii]|uniref:3-oxoacyl-ACP reductase n=1 Tax=Bordetella hinzii TaxID=103855 RepID=A0AAN1RU33_9BORD|nr:SDR family oxidoreductase [Bordetella hinzii]AKQ54156.1 Gluconate 5-dehydrogenase [Bordetella hinzii]AKQ58670.1 Gluconate 5-dehydrogenase [Bordetella hinzii]AZW16039.1 3-oxoacyl-ACP reductase [Bordetella hinzii]KCB26759.1 NAD(P)H-binding protein, PF13460 family [Bordetella hinzii L60]KCB49452.1 NAD(P)H-binding protein, PF13460 family [Bordetella hinzii 4161]